MAEKKTKLAVETRVGETAVPGSDPRFSKDQLLGFQRYRGRGDLLRALLNEKKKYTVAEADAAIGKFMKGRVN